MEEGKSLTSIKYRFYDRTIALIQKLKEEKGDAKPLITIGVGYEVLKCEELPYNSEYDKPLNYIITEEKVYDFL